MNNDESSFKKNLLDSEEDNIFNSYLEKYGGRFGNELKLETLNLYEHFPSLRNLLLLYGNNSYNYNHDIDNNIDLSLIEKVVLYFFKKHAVNRENLRLLRSNIIDVVRKVFERIGVIFKSKGLIDDERDIFYLKITEIINKDIEKLEPFQKIIETRKKEYKKFINEESLMNHSHFISVNGILSDSDFIEKQNNDNNIETNKKKYHEWSTLKGEGVSSGILRGIVRKYDQPIISNNGQNNNEIIVAKNIDPGWTCLIGTCPALIVSAGQCW